MSDADLTRIRGLNALLAERDDLLAEREKAIKAEVERLTSLEGQAREVAREAWNRAAAAEAKAEALTLTLHEIDIIAGNTIPPDGKDAAYAALGEIIRLINQFRIKRQALAAGEAQHG